MLGGAVRPFALAARFAPIHCGGAPPSKLTVIHRPIDIASAPFHRQERAPFRAVSKYPAAGHPKSRLTQLFPFYLHILQKKNIYIIIKNK